MPTRYRLQPTLRVLTARRDGLLKRLRKVGPILSGSLVLMARTCGNVQHCHCRTGRKHVNTYLSYKVDQKTRMVYIPVDLEDDVRLWSAEYRKLKDLMGRLSEIQRGIVRGHVQDRRRRH
jgi:uncharacterized protein DUF6788